MIRHNGIEIDGQFIRHAGVALRFSRRSKRGELIKKLILDSPATCENLFDYFYGADPEGGPDGGPHVFHIWFQQMQPMLDRAELKLYSSLEGHGRSRKRYWIGPA